jgi:biopolymer transport protein ExbB/TolQ
MSTLPSQSPLSWQRSDIENQFGFRGGRYTATNSFFCSLCALITSIIFYVLMFLISDNWFSDMFVKRGFTPYLMVFLAFWTMFILLFKLCKISIQRKPLNIEILPDEHGFVLSPNTVDTVLANVYAAAEIPRDFILFNRITGTLSNLKNIGQIADVADILNSYNNQDIEAVEISYSLLNGFLWAIPVLGFIGTVQGLSQAIGTFGTVLAAGADATALTSSLQEVTGGLSTAFETTLIALVLALVLHLFATALRKSEDELLLSCSEYCSRNIVSHLRMPKLETLEQS